jgi:hypothetical protein
VSCQAIGIPERKRFFQVVRGGMEPDCIGDSEMRKLYHSLPLDFITSRFLIGDYARLGGGNLGLLLFTIAPIKCENFEKSYLWECKAKGRFTFSFEDCSRSRQSRSRDTSFMSGAVMKYIIYERWSHETYRSSHRRLYLPIKSTGTGEVQGPRRSPPK